MPVHLPLFVLICLYQLANQNPSTSPSFVWCIITRPNWEPFIITTNHGFLSRKMVRLRPYQRALPTQSLELISLIFWKFGRKNKNIAAASNLTSHCSVLVHGSGCSLTFTTRRHGEYL